MNEEEEMAQNVLKGMGEMLLIIETFTTLDLARREDEITAEEAMDQFGTFLLPAVILGAELLMAYGSVIKPFVSLAETEFDKLRESVVGS